LECSSLKHLLTWQFFYGVDWTTIRNIDSPFVPHLRSMTDTSYFPTDDLDQVPEQPAAGDPSGNNATKDLAFLGFTCVLNLCKRPKLTITSFRRYEML
jgi:hypothetical protein